jgi:hypothetical protein
VKNGFSEVGKHSRPIKKPGGITQHIHTIKKIIAMQVQDLISTCFIVGNNSYLKEMEIDLLKKAFWKQAAANNGPIFSPAYQLLHFSRSFSLITSQVC